MTFQELRHGDWFIFPEAAKDTNPALMVKLEIVVERANSAFPSKQLTAVAIFSGSFSMVPDEAEVIKTSMTLEELPAGSRFILVEDMGKATGVVIYKKRKREKDSTSDSGPAFFMTSEDGSVMTSFPEDIKVIKIR